MGDLHTVDLDIVYAVVAFGTTLGGLATLSAGYPSTVIAPAVMFGAVVVGFISLYWLFGGGESRTG